MTIASGQKVGLRLLVIEDDISFQKLIRERLKKRWPDAEIAIMDPTRGSKIGPDFKAAQFDVVLLDNQLGPQNGLQLLSQFRKHKHFPPVIMVTGSGSEELAVAAIAAGAEDYLAKQGLQQEKLVAVIEQTLAKHPPRPREAPPPPVQQPLPVIDGYDLKSHLGQGAAGHVYRAVQKKTGQEVALKVIRINLSQQKNDELIDRAMREFALMQNIQSSRVARIWEPRFDDDRVIIAMELLPGGSVGGLLRAGKLDQARALRIIRHAAQALTDIHAAGVIHRDLKPSNMMLREDESVALIDFGIAREIEAASGLTKVGQMLGTATYVSPEQAMGEPVDRRTDLYSLGVVFFELLSGSVPYRALTQLAVVQKHIHAPLPELPEDCWLFQPLINRLMAKSPADRYQYAGAFMEELDTLAPRNG